MNASKLSEVIYVQSMVYNSAQKSSFERFVLYSIQMHVIGGLSF